MTRKLLVTVAAGVCLVLLLGYGLANSERTDDATSSPPASTRGGDGPEQAPSAPGSTDPTGPESNAADADSADPGESGTAADPTDQDEPSGGIGGVEVIPEQPGQPEGLPGLDGTNPSAAEPLISTPLPGQSSALGQIVKGYPADVLGPTPRSRVTSSSVSPSGTALQVALDATSASSPDAVLRRYRIRLGQRGFEEATAPAVGGSTAAAFIRRDDTVTVTVTPGSPSGTTYTVFGTLHTVGS